MLNVNKLNFLTDAPVISDSIYIHLLVETINPEKQV